MEILSLLELTAQALLLLLAEYGLSSESGAPPLLKADLTRDVSARGQCMQDGVKNCRAVIINFDYLKTNIQPGDSLYFIAGSDLSMKLQRPPMISSSGSESYSFSLSDGGEGMITVKHRNTPGIQPAVFASIKPATGSVMYSVESCGQGCNVIYERDRGYFNQFQD